MPLLLFAMIIFFSFANFTLFKYLTAENLSLQNKTLILFIFNLLIILSCEFLFRFTYRLLKKKKYQLIKKIKLEDLYHIPHPFLTAVYKKNSIGQKEMSVFYPLNKDMKFKFPILRTNNEGFMDGLDGSRNIILPKPENEKRIICLGASTTGNYIKYNDEVSSYPLELEKLFSLEYPKKNIKVINCGFGGWTSAEILINFLLKVFSYSPDIIIIYHAHNDIPSYLTPNFQNDYSHSRRNFAFEFSKFKKNRYIPDIPLAIYNVIALSIFKNWNPRVTLGDAISQNTPNYSANFDGLDIYKRNIEHIIKICIQSEIDVVLSSYAHFLYDEIKGSEVHLKIRSGIEKENLITRKLADKYNLSYVDNFKLIPSEEEFFVDSIHFSPKGMSTIARNFFSEISENLL